MTARTLLLSLLPAIAACVPPPSRSASAAGPVYVIVDVEALAGASPGAFELPSSEMRRGLKVGDRAKLFLQIPPGTPGREYTGERPWVEVTQVVPGPRYWGRLANTLVVFTEVDPEAPITFGPEHVVEIFKD